MPILDRLGGPERRAQILAGAGIFEVPDGQAMVPERWAARLFHQLRVDEPDLAPCLSHHAGLATGDYILANRIPGAARAVLRAMPAPLAARLLMRAISRHAWTFAGTGRFAANGPYSFEIRDNPLVAGEQSPECLCHWHAAVFAQLYRALVAPDFTCREVTCRAQGRGRSCRFQLTRRKAPTSTSAFDPDHGAQDGVA